MKLKQKLKNAWNIIILFFVRKNKLCVINKSKAYNHIFNMFIQRAQDLNMADLKMEQRN